MLITVFRKYKGTNLFFLAALILLIRMGLFMDRGLHEIILPYTPYADFLRKFNLDFISDLRANLLVTGLVVFVQGIILNRIITFNNLFQRSSYLPALMYVVLASMYPPFLTFTPVTLCNFFLLWFLDRMFCLYRGGNILRVMFDMGMIVGIASAFYYPFLYLSPVIWYCLFVFRTFGWREWLAPLIGGVIPYILVFTWYFYMDDASGFLEIWEPVSIRLPAVLPASPYDSLALLPLLFLLGLALNQIRISYLKNIIQVRKSQQSLAALSFLILLAYFLSAESGVTHFMMLAMPLSVYLAHYFINARVKWLFEILFLLLLASIFYFQWSFPGNQ